MNSVPKPARDPSPLWDSHRRYGWLSIALHWLVAVAVIAMWFVGQAIASAEPSRAAELRGLHVTAGLSLWLLIALRIGWRLRRGHPRVEGLGDTIFGIARAVHYLLLVLLAAMLISGPLLAIAAGLPLRLPGGLELLAAGPGLPALQSAASAVHGAAATGLVVLVLAHIAGAFKHLMFNDDDSFLAMLRPNPAASVGASGHRPAEQAADYQQRD